MKLIIASNNNHKITEIKNICKNFDYEICSLKDENIFIDVEEDGTTIEENSFKKAKEIYKLLKERGESGFLVLSDDSGLMVDYLNGAPGVYSKRFSGENSTDEDNLIKVLTLLEEAKDNEREAKMVTVLTLMDENGGWKQFLGEVHGEILREKRGENGFGYDSIFYIKEKNKSFGEISDEEKNSISHRYNALLKLQEYLKEI